MEVGAVSTQGLSAYQAALAVAPQAAPVPGPVEAAQAAATGGLDSNSAAGLLASLGGAQSATAGRASLAIAAYQAQQAYPVSAPAAQGSPSSTPTTTLLQSPGPVPAPAPPAAAPASQDPAANPAVQQALQASLNPMNVSLLA
jgi:hypothetical protein